MILKLKIAENDGRDDHMFDDQTEIFMWELDKFHSSILNCPATGLQYPEFRPDRSCFYNYAFNARNV